MGRFVMFVALLSLVCVVRAQEEINLSGYVSNMSTGKDLPNSSVFIPEYNIGTITDSAGYYSLTVKRGKQQVLYSYVGCKTQSQILNLQQDTTINIFLEGKNSFLDEVEVLSRNNSLTSSQEFGKSRFSPKEVQFITPMLGEDDIFKTIQLLPGMQSGNEGTSGLYIRGGGPDQNLVLLNGIPLYNTDHLLGFFSIFNQDAVGNVSIYKGGFPARYSGRLSSVIDITTKEGDFYEYHGNVTVGLLTSKFSLNGPVKNGKTTFSISARRTYADLLMDTFLDEESNDTFGDFYFYDVNASLVHKISPTDRLYFTFYNGLDDANSKLSNRYSISRFEWEERTDVNVTWGNTLGSLRWNHTNGENLSVNTLLALYHYDYEVLTSYERESLSDDDQEIFDLNYNSKIKDLIARVDVSYHLNQSHSLKAGVAYTNHKYDPKVHMVNIIDRYYRNEHVNDTVKNHSGVTAGEVNFYLEDAVLFKNGLFLNLGMNISLFFVQGKVYKSFEPRFTTTVPISKTTNLSFAFSEMKQFVHLLSSSGINLPTDLWVPSTKTVNPKESWQLGLGLNQQLGNKYSLGLESFYKEMDGIVEYKDGASFWNSFDSWEAKVEQGRGWAYGVEALLQKRKGKTTGWIGYTLSWSERKFERINFGRVFPARFDRRHDISFVAHHKLSDQTELGLTWVFGSGNAVTLATQKYYSLNTPLSNKDDFEIDYFEGRNNYRMPNYHRLDLSMSFHKKKEKGQRTWKVGIYNAYSRQNPYFLRYVNVNKGEDDKPQKVLKQLSLFPIVPSVSYSYKF